jgi:hypothetical protein
MRCRGGVIPQVRIPEIEVSCNVHVLATLPEAILPMYFTQET